MDGAPGGNTATATVNIKVTDINDNIPTLEEDEVQPLFLPLDSLDKRDWELGFSVKGMNVGAAKCAFEFNYLKRVLNKLVKSQMLI